jgi:hypothetical protein
MTTVTTRVIRWLEHIKALAGDIPDRLPTSAGEARASEYCRRGFAKAGLAPRIDEFASAGSVFLPHQAVAVLMLAGFALYRIGFGFPALKWLALLVSVFAVVCEIMEITLRPHPIQALLPKRPSRNVYAVVEPGAATGSAERAGATGSGAAPIRDLVLIGHVDSQRTPIIFSTPGWMLAYRLFSTVAFVSFIGQVVFYAGGLLLGWPWAWTASIFPAVMAHLLLFLCLQAHRTRSTPGANDNATGAGLLLTLAEELAAAPLARTRVWLLASGCEEALHEGAKTFFARHKGEMTEPRAVALEMLGAAGPAWLTSEGFVLPLRPAPELRRLAERLAAENPDLGAYPGKVVGGVTEMSDALLAGVPAITLMGVTRENTAPNWHKPSDTVENMDAASGGALERNYRFVRAFIEALDKA